jgi:hypothetical protein
MVTHFSHVSEYHYVAYKHSKGVTALDTHLSGTAIAVGRPTELVERQPLANLGDLLELLPRRKGGGAGSGAPIHSAAAKFLAFVETAPEETPIHLLETEQERFVDYLRSRRHTPDTVRSYRFCLNRLLKEARERGWQTPRQILPSDWAEVMTLARPKEVQSIVRFAARIRKSPSIFGEDDLRAWCQERIQAGRTLMACRVNMSLFRSLCLGLSSHTFPPR